MSNQSIFFFATINIYSEEVSQYLLASPWGSIVIVDNRQKHAAKGLEET